MGQLRLGTSSWSEKGWKRSFYPKGTTPGEFLSYYATRFDCVEADVTYYRVPGPDLVAGWVRKVGPDFRLCAKFPRDVVHAGQGPRPEAGLILDSEGARRATDGFLQAMSLLGERCGPLVLQFPYFNLQAFGSPEPFLERLDRYLEQLPGGFRYGVEIRNRHWLAGPLVELLRARGVGLVLADLPLMPHPDSLDLDLLTSDTAYIRLVGDRKATDALTKTFHEIVIDRSDRLARWASYVGPLAARAKETFVFANNHFAGHGPATVAQLAALLRTDCGG